MQKDNLELTSNELKRFRQYFFKVILRVYYNTELHGLDYFNVDSYNIIKDEIIINKENKTEYVPKDEDLQCIPDDMFVSVNKSNDYISVQYLNDKEIIDQFKTISKSFEDDGTSNLLKDIKKINKNEVSLKEYSIFSRYKLGKTIKIVFSYFRKERAELVKLLDHLRPMERSGKIEIFYDANLTPGKEFKPELEHKFKSADIIISMITPKWANSDFILSHELPIALNRANDDGFRHLPLLIKPTNYKQIKIKQGDLTEKDLKKFNLVKDDVILAANESHLIDPYLEISNIIIKTIEELSKVE